MIATAQTKKTVKIRIMRPVWLDGKASEVGSVWEVSKSDAFELILNGGSAELVEGEPRLESASPDTPRVYFPDPEDPAPRKITDPEPRAESLKFPSRRTRRRKG
jgi:hypothetical protein